MQEIIAAAVTTEHVWCEDCGTFVDKVAKMAPALGFVTKAAALARHRYRYHPERYVR